MGVKEEFSAEEWTDVVSGPALAAGLLIFGSPSNPAQIADEALAGGEAYREGLLGATTPVMQALAEQFQNVSAEDVRKHFELGEKVDSVERMQRNYISRIQRTLEVIRARGGDDDAQAYGKFIMHVAGKVANAAKEGGFLGFGGTTISESEQQLLDELSKTLGV